MSQFKYDKDEILRQTDGGLKVIEHLYNSEKLFSGSSSSSKPIHFAVSFIAENTESAIIDKKTIGTNNVKVHIFKTGDRYNCFDLVMLEKNIEFPDACKWIAETLALNLNGYTHKKGKFEFKDAEASQNDGDVYIEYNEQLSESELKYLGPYVGENEIDIFKIKSVKSITRITQYHNHKKHGNAKKQMITSSTENFPIYAYDYGSWQKIYQPYNKYLKENKKGELKEVDGRFSYIGNKPENYVFGLDSLKEYYYSTWRNKNISEDNPEPKFKHIIIASGDRDGLNISSLGFPVVWLNSETAKPSYNLIKELYEMAENICYCGDLDNTGVTQTIALALKFIDIKIIWLPKWLMSENKGKDLTDFVKYQSKRKSYRSVVNEFTSMHYNCAPARFWDAITDDDGKVKKYTINNESLHLFFRYRGIYLYKDKSTDKDDVDFIQVKNNRIRKLYKHEVKRIPIDYLRESYKPIPLINTMHRSAQISLDKLTTAGLNEFYPNIKTSGNTYQLLFFKNNVWKVTKNEITKLNYKDLDTQIWEEDIIPFEPTILTTKSFKITRLGEENYDIEILDKNNSFLNYLINTSRIHWKEVGLIPYQNQLHELENRSDLTDSEKAVQKEKILKHYRDYRKYNQFNIAENGFTQDELNKLPKDFREGLTQKQIEGLTQKQIQEQKLGLVNKLFTYGYLHHTYRRKDKPWLQLAMDYKISDTSESSGGTGKSIFTSQAMRLVNHSRKSYHGIDGKNQKFIESGFHFTGITEQTNYVSLNDASSFLALEAFFNLVDDDWTINNKKGDITVVPFKNSPKISISTNFGMYKIDGSDIRRTIFTSFSDYYHAKTKDYFEEYKVSDDFNGSQLFGDFSKEMTNKTFNLIAECIKFFLSTNEKINSPMMNINKRNALQVMGEDFLDWANGYFSDDGTKLDRKLVKKEVFDAFKGDNYNNNKLSKWDGKRFYRAIEKWCEFYGYVYNPKEEQNKDGYIRTKDANNKAQQALYIKTKKAASKLTKEQINLELDI